MQTPDNTLGPPPEWEVDRTEFSVEVPVLVTIEADADAERRAFLKAFEAGDQERRRDEALE